MLLIRIALYVWLIFVVSRAQSNVTGDQNSGSSENDDLNVPEMDNERPVTPIKDHDKDHLQFNIPVGENVVTLNLERNPRILASLPVYLGTSEYSFVQLNNRDNRDFSAYQDSENKASFILWESNTTDGSPRKGMRGVFETENEIYTIESIDDDDMAMGDSIGFGNDNRLTMVNGMPMTLNKVNDSLIEDVARSLDDTILDGLQNLTDWVDAPDPEGNASSSSHSRRKRSFRNYEVELYLIIDYSMYRKWEKQSKGFYYYQREAEAVNNLRFYFAHVLNGMDLRLRTIREYDFHVTLRPVGMYIAKTREASYWTEYYPYNEGGGYVEGYRALDALEDWITSDKNKLPYFDQLTLFTDHSLFSHYTGGRRGTFRGISDIGGICGPLRASINTDRGHFSSIQTATHELGHSLGAYHDGIRGCSSRDQYIMAVSPGQITKYNQHNPMKFSTCSINSFRNNLHRLSVEGMNCLLQRNNSYSDARFRNIYEQPGQRFSPDEQCKNIHGRNSFYCGGGNNDQSLCLSMQCWDPTARACTTSTEQRAADGTTCGSKKWCSSGECKYNSRATYLPSGSCIYGDFKGSIMEVQGNFKCSSISPYRCYEDDKMDVCCKTCTRLKTGPKGCEYGDREPTYCRTKIQSRHCYDPNIQSRCCKTCSQMKRRDALPGCEFGDKQRFCETIKAHNCYRSAQMCCQTCKDKEIGEPGCEYGNKVSWCRYYANQPYRCYERTVRSSCCDMCKRASTGPADCQWGDRVPFCTLRDCESSSRQRDCCKTCANFKQPTTYSKTSNCKDKASWCRYIHPSSCYRSSNVCCATCKRHKTGPSDCPYGDKYSWCNKSQYCSRPEERTACCRSCA